MPLYEYLCKKCGHRFEKIQKFSDKMISRCPECGGAVEQVISAPAVQFKGSGWYVTDYPKKGSGAASSSATEGDSPGKETKEGKEGKEAKSAGTKETKKEEKSKPEASQKKHKKD